MNICSSSDLDWIERDGLNKEDIKKILEDIKFKFKEQDIKNPIFHRLLKNYVSDIPPVPKYKLLLGCSSVIYLVSRKYDKKILLLGDIHIPHNFQNTKTSITATSYFENYFKTNTKLIDFFIEIPLFVKHPGLKTSELSYFFNKFRGCYNDRNCSFRIHATDVRELLDKDPVLSALMPLIRAFEIRDFNRARELSNKLTDINDVHKYINFTLINNIPLRKEINKINFISLKRHLENFCLHSASRVKLDGNTMFLDILNFLENPNTLETETRIIKYIFDILTLLNPVIEGYTLARMFKRVEGLYNPEPKYIVVFQGGAHIKNLRNFLFYNDFQILFEKDVGILRAIDISSLPQPIFE